MNDLTTRRYRLVKADLSCKIHSVLARLDFTFTNLLTQFILELKFIKYEIILPPMFMDSIYIAL